MRLNPRIVQRNWGKYDTFQYLYDPAKLQRDEFLRSFIKLQPALYSWPNIWKRLGAEGRGRCVVERSMHAEASAVGNVARDGY